MHCYKHTSYDVEGATWWREMLLFVFRTLPVYLLINYGLCDNKPSTNEAIVHDFLPCFIYVYFFLCFYCYNQFNTLLMVSVTGLVSGWKLNIPFGGGSGSWVAESACLCNVKSTRTCCEKSYVLLSSDASYLDPPSLILAQSSGCVYWWGVGALWRMTAAFPLATPVQGSHTELQPRYRQPTLCQNRYKLASLFFGAQKRNSTQITRPFSHTTSSSPLQSYHSFGALF